MTVKALALATALALGLTPAMAQSELTIPLPDDYTTAEQEYQFRLCRAALLLHLDAKDSDSSLVPREVAETLMDQMNFIMSEAILNKSAQNVADGQALIEFAENWFLSFGRTIREEQGRLAVLEEREKIILDCTPTIWRISREYIDYLIKWRARAINAPPLPEPPRGR